jgi:hypothetical protein
MTSGPRRTRRTSPWLWVAPTLVAGVALWLTLGGVLAPPADAPGGEGDAAAVSPDGRVADAPDAARGGSLEGRRGPPGRGDAPPLAEPAPLAKTEAVHGHVLDTKDAPVRGATVTLHAHDPAEARGATLPPALATATSGEDGAFVVGPAPAGARLRVRAEAAGLAAAVAPASRGARVDLVLERGGALRLFVRDGAGAPVRGAEVRVLSVARTAVPTTNAEGEALLDGLPTGALQLRVSAAGQAPVRLSDVVIEPARTVERTCVVGRGVLLAGRVVDEAGGAGVSGATVTVRPRDEPAATGASVEADAEGRFRVDGAGGPAEWVNVTAARDGYALTTQTLRLQAFPGEAQEVTLKVSRGGDAGGPAGTVVDAEGRGVAGARVVYAGYARGPEGTDTPSVETDGDGRFALPLPSGSGKGWSLVVGAFAAGKGMGATQVHGAKSGGVVIRTGGSGTVAGKVTGAAGEPLEGAAVTLTYDWNAKAAPVPVGDAQPWLYAQLFWDPRAPPLAAVTDASGAFRMEGVPVGAFVAEAVWGLERASATEPVVVRAGAQESVVVSLGLGRTIEGRVVDAAGAPVAGAAVNGFDPSNSDPRARPRASYARTDGDGVFRLRNADGGRWTLTATAAGFSPAAPATASPGDRGVEIRMTSLGRIEGIVLLDGAPYTGGYTVSAQLSAPSGEEERMRSSDEGGERLRFSGRAVSGEGNRSDTFSSVDGRFVLRGLAAGAWKVNVTTTENWVPQSATEVSVGDGRATTGVEFRLTRGASISGVLAEDGGATAVSGGQVSLRIVGAPATGGLTRGGSATDARGRYAASGLAGGTYTLYATTPSGNVVEEEIRLDAGQAVVRDVTVPRTGAISVTVLDPAGAPASGIQVGIQTASGRWIQPNWDLLRKQNLVDASRPDAWQRVQQTDAEGKNLRRHVPAGRVQVTARHPSGKPNAGPVTVDVQSDRTTEVVLTLDADVPPVR